jgi:hypothetical protein
MRERALSKQATFVLLAGLIMLSANHGPVKVTVVVLSNFDPPTGEVLALQLFEALETEH